MRGEAVPSTEVPYVYRVLPAAVVAALPLPTRDGFLVLNGLATVATGPLLFTLLRRHGATARAGLLAVLWWAALPTTVRFTVHYPTTLDALGFALLALLLLLASDRRSVLFGIALAPAVLTRENTLLVAAVLWLRLLPQGALHATARTAAAVLPAAALFVAVRIAPPVPPTMWWTQSDLVLMHINALLTRPEVALRAVAAIPLSLGLFAVIPILAVRGPIATLRAERGWAFYLVGTLALAAAGGLDHDRFALWLLPVLAALTFIRPSIGDATGSAAALTLLHLLAVRWLWPMDAEGRQLLATWMDADRFALALAAAAIAAAGAWIILRRRRRDLAVATRRTVAT
jgi:hypothetical protein